MDRRLAGSLIIHWTFASILEIYLAGTNCNLLVTRILVQLVDSQQN